jgi:poly-gamma-glutamate synthesis protein (capsule biosynthesis protein)
MSAADTFWWLYKYYFKQVEEPEPDKGIEEHFSGRCPEFLPPEGFCAERRAVVSAGGDFIVSDYIREYNTAHLFEDVEDFFFDANLACVNLESPIVPSEPFKGFPKNLLVPLKLNNSPGVFDAVYRGGKGVRLFTTANNHALDRGEKGLLETMDFLDQRGALYVGTARSAAARDAFPVLEENGIRIAFLSYTFALNGKKRPEGRDYLVNVIELNNRDCNLSLLEAQLRLARKEKKADIVIACLHWGYEFESFPTERFITLGHRIIGLGVDVIIGNHAHGLQPAEQYVCRDNETGLERRGLILYALGDILSWHPAKNTRLAALAKIHFAKGFTQGSSQGKTQGSPDVGRRAWIDRVEIKPIYKYAKMLLEKCDDFRVLDLYRLEKKLETGKPPLPLSREQRREIRRLAGLARRVMPGSETNA